MLSFLGGLNTPWYNQPQATQVPVAMDPNLQTTGLACDFGGRTLQLAVLARLFMKSSNSEELSMEMGLSLWFGHIQASHNFLWLSYINWVHY